MENRSRKEREHLAKEQEIIDAAEKIFAEAGFIAARMEEIAKEAQFTRKTLYQYFANKYELYYAVVIRGSNLLLTNLRSGMDLNNTGFEKLRQMGWSYYKFYEDHKSLFSLMNSVGQIKSFGPENAVVFEAENDQLFNFVFNIIDEGKSDGSIRLDIDTKEAAYSIIFLITGLFYEISLSGSSYTKYFQLDEKQFIKNTLELILHVFQTP